MTEIILIFLREGDGVGYAAMRDSACFLRYLMILESFLCKLMLRRE